MKLNKFHELECECGGLFYPTNSKWNTGEYFCDSCGKVEHTKI